MIYPSKEQITISDDKTVDRTNNIMGIKSTITPKNKKP